MVARQVFNAPSLRVHEGMFLVFGMQYLVAGACAALAEAHVKASVFRARWSPLRKAPVELLPLVFVFIFARTLLVTGWIFALDATVVNGVSFSEWQIACWPFRWAIVVRGALLVVPGIPKSAQDVSSVPNSLQGARARGNEIGIAWLTVLMFANLMVLLMAGLPLTFVTGGLAIVFLSDLGDAQTLTIVPSRIFPLTPNYQLSATPLFIFLAAMLERDPSARRAELRSDRQGAGRAGFRCGDEWRSAFVVRCALPCEYADELPAAAARLRWPAPPGRP